MRPRKVDVERVATAMERGEDYSGLAWSLVSEPDDEDGAGQEHLAIVTAALRLLLAEKEPVLRAAKQLADTADMGGMSDFHLDAENVADEWCHYTERVRARRKRAKEATR